MRVMQMLAGAPQGGAETFFVSLARAFERARREGAAELEQLALIRRQAARADVLRASGVETVELPFGGWFDLTTRPRIAAQAERFKPDVVLAFMNRAASWMPSGSFLKLARVGGYYDVKYYRRCDHLVCLTEDLRRHVVEQGWPGERAHVIANFATADEHPAEARAAHDTPADAPLILAPGRLHRGKGLDVLLRALTREPRAHLWIAGEGPERARLHSLADELGVSARVRFLGWRADRGALYRACDLVAFPTLYEAFGTVTLEAWAYGKPLVAADAAGPAGLVRPEEDALLVPRGDDAALATAVGRLIDAPELAARLVANGHARHRREFTEDACVRRYLELFERLTGKPALIKETAS